MPINIALCGLATRLGHLLEIVINSSNPQKFHAATTDKSFNPQIVIVDVDSRASLDAYQDHRRLHPSAICITISDHESTDGTPYRIPRKSLFILIVRVLNEIIERELTGNGLTRSQAFSTSQSPSAADALPAAPRSEHTVAANNDVPRHKLTALVVDDSLTVREQMRMALERLDIACDQADSAETAIQLLLHNSYDLAFLDVVMPGTDGYTLCRKIKHDSATRLIPVLMLTSRSSPFDRVRGALAGCDSYLTKPITWDIFSHAVDKALMKSPRNDHVQTTAHRSRA